MGRLIIFADKCTTTVEIEKDGTYTLQDNNLGLVGSYNEAARHGASLGLQYMGFQFTHAVGQQLPTAIHILSKKDKSMVITKFNDETVYISLKNQPIETEIDVSVSRITLRWFEFDAMMNHFSTRFWDCAYLRDIMWKRVTLSCKELSNPVADQGLRPVREERRSFVPLKSGPSFSKPFTASVWLKFTEERVELPDAKNTGMSMSIVGNEIMTTYSAAQRLPKLYDPDKPITWPEKYGSKIRFRAGSAVLHNDFFRAIFDPDGYVMDVVKGPKDRYAELIYNRHYEDIYAKLVNGDEVRIFADQDDYINELKSVEEDESLEDSDSFEDVPLGVNVSCATSDDDDTCHMWDTYDRFERGYDIRNRYNMHKRLKDRGWMRNMPMRDYHHVTYDHTSQNIPLLAAIERMKVSLGEVKIDHAPLLSHFHSRSDLLDLAVASDETPTAVMLRLLDGIKV